MKEIGLIYLYVLTFALQAVSALRLHHLSGKNCTPTEYLKDACGHGSRLKRDGISCLWKNDVLMSYHASSKMCDRFNGGLAIAPTVEDIEEIKAYIKETLIYESWIAWIWSIKEKRFYHKDGQYIPHSRAKQILRSWKKDEDSPDKRKSTYNKDMCLVVDWKFNKLFDDFIYYDRNRNNISYKLRDCESKQYFFCHNIALGHRLHNQKKSFSEALDICDGIKDGMKYTLFEPWRKTELYEKFLKDEYKKSYIVFHLGLDFIIGGRFWINNNSLTKIKSKRYKGMEVIEKEGMGSRRCTTFTYRDRFESDHCEEKKNYICDLPFKKLKHSRPKLEVFKVHRLRKSEKYFLGERLKFICTGDTIHTLNQKVGWKMFHTAGGTTFPQEIDYNFAETTTAPVLKRNVYGRCVHHHKSTVEITLNKVWDHDRLVYCFWGTPKNNQTFDCSNKRCTSIVIGIEDTSLTKPQFYVHYLGYPGAVFKGYPVTIVCSSDFSIKKMTEKKLKNSLVLVSSINGSQYQILNEIESIRFDVRFYTKKHSYNKTAYTRFSTKTHTVFVEVKFNMTQDLAGVTFDCFGYYPGEDDKDLYCTYKDLLCTKSGRFLPRDPVKQRKKPVQKNYFAFYLVMLLLTGLVSSVMCIPCRGRSEEVIEEEEEEEEKEEEAGAGVL